MGASWARFGHNILKRRYRDFALRIRCRSWGLEGSTFSPTSPLREVTDIDNVISACVEGGSVSAMTVTRMEKPLQWCYYIGADGRLNPVLQKENAVLRRQESRSVYYLNGAVYCWKAGFLKDCTKLTNRDTVGIPMTSENSVDIDNLFDFQLAEFIYSNRGNALEQN